MNTSPENAGLLLCAHGSRSEGWRRAVTSLQHALSTYSTIETHYRCGVQVGFLNSCEPSVVQAARALLSSGADTIVALPLFVTASTHLAEELPVVLGQGQNPAVRARLLESGVECLEAGLPIHLVEGLNGGDIVPASVTRRALSLAAPCLERAVAVPYYGSTRAPLPWEKLLQEVYAQVLGEGYGACAGCPVGQVVDHSPTATQQTLRALLAQHNEVLVVPALTAKGKLYPQVIEAAINGLSPAQRERVVYGADAILPDDAITDALASIALSVP